MESANNQQKNSTAIFCTIASFNEDLYIERLCEWVEELAPIECDLYAISDGEVSFEKYRRSEFKNLKIFPLPISLGRGNTNNKFPGYRRSFGIGLWLLSNILEYRYIAFLENDSKILNYDAFKNLLYTSNAMYGGSNIGLGGVDSCCMVLNNKEKREEMAKYYLMCDNIYEDKNFEHFIEEKWHLDKGFLITKRINKEITNKDLYKNSNIVVATQASKNFVIGKNNNTNEMKWSFIER